jgi:hypothetical protein
MLVIQLDGFAYRADGKAFRQDRRSQNALVLEGSSSQVYGVRRFRGTRTGRSSSCRRSPTVNCPHCAAPDQICHQRAVTRFADDKFAYKRAGDDKFGEGEGVSGAGSGSRCRFHGL